MIRRLTPGPIKRLRHRLRQLDRLEALERGGLGRVPEAIARLEQVLEALGRLESRQNESLRGPLQRHEFRVYSHAGEDGIIQFLIHNVPIPNRTFVEFGVEDYREANTRFLLVNDDWSGLVLDGEAENIAKIRRDPVYWNHDLSATAAFVTRENVNELLADAGLVGEIGLLSVDVDGNDYWIFDAIEVVRPAIAIVEYNHRFGPSRSVTIPYDPGFVRRQTDDSWLVAGASLAAIVGAAERKGMAFVGCNTFGNNAFFVRADLVPEWLPTYTAEQGFVAGRFKESMLKDAVEFVPTSADEQRLVAEANLVGVP
jgi:hypothetical protein